MAAIGLIAGACRLDRLLVPPHGALLCVSPSPPDTLRDSAAFGSTMLRSHALTIENCGAGELHWHATASPASPWVSVQPESGSVGDGSAPRVIFQPAALDTGSYRETIFVTSTGSSGVAEVPVQFAIHPCRATPLTLDDSASGTLTTSDCGAPHRAGSFGRVYTFPGTANDSVSLELVAGFEGYVVLDTTLEVDHPPFAETGTCPALAGGPCLYYQRLPRSAPYHVEVTSLQAADSGAFLLRLIHPRSPAPPTSLDQRLEDSVTSLPPGATVGATSLLLHAVLSDPDLADSLHLEVEVRPVSVGFTGPNLPNGPAVPNGAPAWVSVGGLSDKTAYHWRARAGDQTGRTGPWVSFGGTPDFVVNVLHPPNSPTALGQARGDGTGILVGAVTDTDVVILSATVSDPDPGDLLRLQVEVRPLGVDFSTPTDSSAPMRDGGPLQVVVGPLAGGVGYHWRARAGDGGASSPWVAFGGNAETAQDFGVAQSPPVQLVFTGQPGTTAINAAITPPVQVTVLDAAGRTSTGFTGTVTISIEANPGRGQLSGTTTIAAQAGVATFANLSINRPGLGYTLRATTAQPALTAVSASFTVYRKLLP